MDQGKQLISLRNTASYSDVQMVISTSKDKVCPLCQKTAGFHTENRLHAPRCHYCKEK